MVKTYDRAVLDLIKVFTNNIPVIGLQNDDTGDISESTFTQAGKKTPEDKVPLPLISVFRNPEIAITDSSVTKRPSMGVGYRWVDSEGYYSLVCMRTTLSYTVDVIGVSKASVEDIAVKLFFRLRNNPEIRVDFSFPDADYKTVCKAEIQLGDKLTHIRTNTPANSQLYKIRFTFNLVNANIYDLINKPVTGITYSIEVKLNESSGDNYINVISNEIKGE